ncbi:MAG: TrmH family RNA methyltransferase [Bacteroidota bacterium]
MQLNHYSKKFKSKTFPITLVCDNVISAPNIGGLFRAADAFGVEQIIFCGNEIPMGRKMTKASRSTENTVKYIDNADITQTLIELKESNYQIIALEITSTSTAITNFRFKENTPIALIIGAENFGVSDNVLKISDEIYHIEMFGKNSSMNVVQAASIALYEMTKQFS